MNFIKDKNVDLKKKSINSVFHSSLGTFIPTIIRFITIPILARLILPEYFGLVAMVAVFLNFAAIFKDLGLGQAIIQKTNLSNEDASSIFWIILIINLIILLILLLLTPLIASFYNEDRLIEIMYLLSINIFISGLSIYPMAILKKELKFLELSNIRIISTISCTIIGIILALLKYNYWALIWMNITGNIIATLLLWYKCNWKPAKFQYNDEVKKMINFGKYISGFTLVNYFSRNIDNLLIGKIFGSISLGLYSKAYQLLMLPIDQIRSPIMDVALPVLSKIKNKQNRYKNYYKKIIFNIAFITMPLTSIIFLFSYNIINIVLGENWLKTSDFFVILSLVAFIQPVLTAGRGLPMLSLGYSKRYFKFGLIQSFITTIGMCIGSQFNSISIPLGYVISYYLIIIPSIPFCLKETTIKSSDFYKSILYPLLSSLIMIITVKIFIIHYYNGSIIFDKNTLNTIELFIFIFFSITIYIICFIFTKTGRMMITDSITNLKLLINK